MRNLIFYNWLVLGVASLLVGIYISIFENFLADKAYLYFLMALAFGGWYWKKRKEGRS